MAEPASEKHKANWVTDYFQAHDGKLKELEGVGVVRTVHLITEPKTPTPTTPFMKMKGKIELEGNMRVDVKKLLRVIRLPAINRYKVYTVEYSYSLVKNGDQTIFRYCSMHDEREDSPHHHKFHHKHQFAQNGQDDVKTLTEDEWPTLGEVLDEAADHIDWSKVHR